MMNRSGNGRRITRDGKKELQRDEFNGKTGDPKRNGRPAHEFKGGEKKNGNGHLLGMRVTPINHERTAILQQIHDLEHLGLIRNSDPASMDYYIKLDPESSEGIKHLADLREKLGKLNTSKPEPGM
jgi:hypothetical protein